MKYGRNGGCIIKKGDSLFRVAQDCVKRYGDNVHVMKIDELNNKSYPEHLQMENIIPLSVPFYAEGGHQFYQTVFQGYTIVATDAKEYHEYPLAHKMYKLGRIPHKLFGK